MAYKMMLAISMLMVLAILPTILSVPQQDFDEDNEVSDYEEPQKPRARGRARASQSRYRNNDYEQLENTGISRPRQSRIGGINNLK